MKDHSATDLAEHAAKAALAAGGVAPELVNSVIFGNVMQVPKNIYCIQPFDSNRSHSLYTYVICILYVYCVVCFESLYFLP